MDQDFNPDPPEDSDEESVESWAERFKDFMLDLEELTDAASLNPKEALAWSLVEAQMHESKSHRPQPQSVEVNTVHPESVEQDEPEEDSAETKPEEQEP